MVPKMWPGVLPDDMLTPEAALPVQFQHLWHRSRAMKPERTLMLSVLCQAVLDLRKYRFATRRRHQRLYMEAYRWVASTDRTWPFSFENLCEAFNINATVAREKLLDINLPPTEAPDLGAAIVEEAA